MAEQDGPLVIVFLFFSLESVLNVIGRVDRESQQHSTEPTSADLHLRASQDHECEGVEGRGSWSSAASSSMPSIAITMAANSNEKSVSHTHLTSKSIISFIYDV